MLVILLLWALTQMCILSLCFPTDDDVTKWSGWSLGQGKEMWEYSVVRTEQRKDLGVLVGKVVKICQSGYI